MITCGRCGEEIRYGHRGGVGGYWHRETVDHMPIAGPVSSPEEIQQMLDAVARRRAEKAGEPLEGDDDDEEGLDEVPPIEVHRTSVDPKDERVPGGVRTITNLLAKTDGWELYRLTYSRGPYLGSKKCLGVSDMIVLGAIQRSTGRRIVATWRDGKFNTGYAIMGNRMQGRVNSTAMKGFVKGLTQESN